MHLLHVRGPATPSIDLDSAGELVDYLRLMNPDPIDVISIHYDDAMIRRTLGSSTTSASPGRK
jgi:hypothetical protein